MSINYSIQNNGHLINAIADKKVTHKQFIKYEIDHAIDPRLKAPILELFEIKANALDLITREDIHKVLEARKKISIPPQKHKCAIVVSIGDNKGWDIARFYEGMLMLHSPEIVIVFGDIKTAKIWLGIN